MDKNVNKQKLLIVDAVLDLNKKLDAIENLFEEAKLPKNKIALKIFDELFESIYLLLWESIVINVSWLYEKTWYEKNGKKTQKNMVRSLYWYLEERKKSFPKKAAEVDSHLVKIRSLDITVAKVRSIRNKWIVHRDKKAFENPNKYLEEVGLKLEDVKLLIETAHEIIQEHYPITDLTNTGLNRLFRIVEFPDLFLEEIEKVKREIDAREKFKSYN